jgi:hypothetical protein
MPVYDFTEIVDETIAGSHPDPVACKIICKMLASTPTPRRGWSFSDLGCSL